MSKGPFIIAEAGVNHNGRLDLALELVDAAAAARADAVKFQTFRADTLATKRAPKAAYQEVTDTSGDQFTMLKKLELDEAAHHAIAARCRERDIEFMSTPFDVQSVALLDGLGMKRFKVPSGEIDNPILLRAIAKTGKPMIVSTGMSTLTDIEMALAIIARELVPGLGPNAAWMRGGHEALAARVTLLHCTSEYPAPPEAVNLRAIETMTNAFGLSVGYSDHTLGMHVSAAAIAFGVSVIEKHFTLDRSMPGPDHAASLSADELPAFVAAMRDVATALGDGRKVPVPAEIANRAVVRRGVVAVAPIKRGEKLTAENVGLRRPATALPAHRYDEVIGCVASRDYEIDDPIEP